MHIHLRRIFSITGIIFLCYFVLHLALYFTSSFWVFDNTFYFLAMSNFNKALFNNSYSEVLIIFIPLFIHVLIGMKYMLKKKYSFDIRSAYTLRNSNTLQRITAWILLSLLTFHVLQMRFFNHPKKMTIQNTQYFVVNITPSNKIYKIADSLNIKIIETNTSQIKMPGLNNSETPKAQTPVFLAAATSSSLAFLIKVIDSFQSKSMVIFYTIFVLAATFHAFNGLWTFLIYFKVSKTHKIRKITLHICLILMFIFFIFGLTPIFIDFFK